MKDLREADVKNKKVLVRVDFNVFPLKSDEIRLQRTIPTIKYLLSKGADVTLLTHLERNDGKIPSIKTLLPVLKKVLPMEKVDLFENLRKFPGEKNNDMRFAKKLSSLGDIYINEAFPASHREHASIVLLPKLLPAYAGFWFQEEVKKLSKVFNPPHPATLILGGGKIETKLPILKKLLPKMDQALLGGALLNLYVIEGEKVFSEKLKLPKHVIVSNKRVMDVGEQSFDEWEAILKKSKFIVWNGPLGFLEKGFKAGTRKMIDILLDSKAQIIIGGGDTLACLPSGKKLPKNIFVSTGGGAMLDYLLNKTLPGIKALK